MKCPKNRQCPKQPAGSIEYIFDKRPLCKRCNGDKKLATVMYQCSAVGCMTQCVVKIAEDNPDDENVLPRFCLFSGQERRWEVVPIQRRKSSV